MSQTVVLTGANGFLGGNILLSLLEKGFKVKASVRKNAHLIIENHPKLTVFTGALNDTLFLNELCSGADYIIHAAALTRQNIADYSVYEKANVNATKALYEAAFNASVKRFIFISSANTIDSGTIENPGTEIKDALPWALKSHYVRSKAEAEKALLSATNKVPVIILNPGFIIGCNDTGKSSGQLFERIYNSKLQLVPKGGKTFVFAGDVAEAAILAFTHGKIGSRYLLADRPMSLKNVYKMSAKLMHKKLIIIQIWSFLVRSTGLFGSLLRLFYVNTSISDVNMKLLLRQNVYSGEKATSELFFKYTDFEEVLKMSIADFLLKKNKNV